MLAGILSPGYLPAVFTPTGDVTLTAGTPVMIATTTTAQKASIAGGFYPLLLCTVVDLQGGTAASALVYSFRFHSGTDIATYTVAPTDLVNSALRTRSFALIGTESSSAWFPTGTIVELWGSATTQAVTVKQTGTQFMLMLGLGVSP